MKQPPDAVDDLPEPGGSCLVPNAALHNEVELKLDLSGVDVPTHDQLIDVIATVCRLGEARFHHLNALYFDTPGLDIARVGGTLRRRSGGTDAGWHLKLKSSTPGVRSEFQGPVTGSRPPRALREILPLDLQMSPLVPIARLVTEREEMEMYDPDGRVLALLCMDSVWASVPADPHDPGQIEGEPSWRELEVELVADAPRLLDQVRRLLVTAGVGTAVYESKLARALETAGRRLEGFPDQSGAAALTGGLVVLQYIGKQLGVIQALESRVRVNAFDTVHQSRVAIRRLRSALRVFSFLFEEDVVRDLSEELRWFAQKLGGARDTEVLQAYFEETKARDPQRHLVSHLNELHEEALSELHQAMELPRFEVLNDMATNFLVDPPFTSLAGYQVSELLPGALAKAAGKVFRHYIQCLEEPQDAARWHELRKTVKQVRYCSEALVPVMPEVYGFAEAWKAVAGKLGMAQDAQMVTDLLDSEEVRKLTPADHLERLKSVAEAQHLGSIQGARESLSAAFAASLVTIR